jgi:hypothetical protein
VYIQNTAPTVRAAKRMPRVTNVKMAPKKDPTNLTKADSENACPSLYGKGAGPSKPGFVNGQKPAARMTDPAYWRFNCCRA